MKKDTLILIGGFLGAGKTTLLKTLAKKLNNKDLGLVTNDQAANLVDTLFLENTNDKVKEVNGSCFCCNFNGFIDALDYVSNKIDSEKESIILAEPVGSCTDLSATILQPLKDKYSEKYNLKPLTALADPSRLAKVLENHKNPADYIIYKQFEEADVVLINKTDLLTKEELAQLVEKTQNEFKDTKIFTASVINDEGIDAWFDYISNADYVGKKIVEVDYDTYADGEAAFGWLNSEFTLKENTDYSEVSEIFINNVAQKFDDLKLNVGHVKFLLQNEKKNIIGNITGKADSVTLNSEIANNNFVKLTVNARVETDPNTLEKIILEEVHSNFGNYDLTQTALKTLIPGRPNPTFRYREVIKK